MRPIKWNTKIKGATLAYTLMVIAILMIVGTVLGSFAVISLRIATLQHASDKAFYLSDAAMEETLTQLESRVHEAEVYALERVNDTARYYSEVKWQLFLAQLETETNNGTITTERSSELLKNATSLEFHKQFYHFLFGRPTDSSWITQDYALVNADGSFNESGVLLFNENSFDETSFDGLEAISLEPSLKEGFENTNKPLMDIEASFVDNTIELRLTSNGLFNSYNRPIIVEVALVPPDYTQITNSETTNIEVHNNQLLDYALAARGDIIVEGGQDNRVNGNVYTYGTFPEVRDYRVSQQGGLIVGYRNTSNLISGAFGDFDPTTTNTNASLSVSGDVITRSALRVFGSNSNVTVEQDLYANSIQFDRDTVDSNIQVDQNVILFEDLILDGNDPEITIGRTIADGNGMFWGIMEHEPTGAGNTGRSDLSSSIIVNTKSNNPRITMNNAYVAGLAYFNVFRTEGTNRRYYQTGESFTTNNNFYFYDTKAVGSTPVTTTLPTYFDESGNEYYLYDAVDASGNVNESPQFKADLFYTGVDNNPSSISTRDRNIMVIRSLNLDSEEDVLGLENNYALGVMIANSKVIDPYPNIGASGTIKSEYMNAASFENMRRNVLRNADFRMNLLSTRDYLAGVNQDPSDTTPSKLGQFIDFSLGNVTRITNPQDIVIVNSDATRNIYVNVPAAKAATIRANESNAIILEENGNTFLNMNGMIISRGNVFIYNEGTTPLNYSGTIVSDQSIVLKGTGEKVITHNDTWLTDKIAKDPLLTRICHAEDGRLIEIVSVGGVETTSDNASISVAVVNNPSVSVVSGNPLPTQGGMVKSQVEHSFLIRRWSIQN